MEQRWNTKRDIRVSVGKEMMPQFLLRGRDLTGQAQPVGGCWMVTFFF